MGSMGDNIVASALLVLKLGLARQCDGRLSLLLLLLAARQLALALR